MVQGGQTLESNARRRFAAFISYAHADAAIAGKLQSRLERYRLPKHIAAAHADGQAALGQIFRDREDLAAAPSLSDAIRAAITEAEALIVLCSPDAQASRWVGEEIALFRSLHPDRPILAALVRGEPDEAFPAALTQGGNEPLAADLRKEGDGEALGFLKIVAGIAGVPLDTLVQRDAQRRIRRVMWITGAALAAMLVMGVMTTLALQARNEAARQRAEAEGLVEYMLTDLREKLRGVGRPEVMSTVNSRALKYYESQGDLADLSSDSLERRARVLHAMGEDSDLMNDPARSALKIREAYRTTKALLDKEPDNPDRIFAHAQSEYWMGQAAWRKKDRSTTARYWQGYLTQARRLMRLDRDRARSNLEMGYALGNLCDLNQYDNYDLDTAVQQCSESIAFERKALAEKPDSKEVRMALANRYGWLADVLIARKELDHARRARLSEKMLIEEMLSKEPNNFELRFRSISPEFGLILVDIEEGRKAKAAAELSVLIERITKLLKESPKNTEVKRGLARALFHRTKSLVDIDPVSARHALNQTREIVNDIGKTPEQRATLSGYWRGIHDIENILSGQ